MASMEFPVAETLYGGSKRKCIDDVADEFSQFSLSSPARKMRRLDGFVSPVTIDEITESGIDASLGHQPIELEINLNNSKMCIPPNEEKALVLYRPMNSSMLASGVPTYVSFQVDHNFIAEFKEKASGRVRGEIASVSNARAESDNRLAVVPWVPSKFPDGSSANATVLQDQQLCPVETEDTAEDENMPMDVEEENFVDGSQITNALASGVSLQQWQQQHCMNLPPVNASTPVMWSW